MKTPIAILASGRGSNFEAIHRATLQGALDARIVAVLSDRPDAPVLVKACEAGLNALAVPPPRQTGSTEERRKLHEEAIVSTLQPYAPRFLILAGYMRVLGSGILGAFRSDRGFNRIVNIHPSLLPAFPGTGGYRQAFEYGAKIAGATVHLVDRTLDGGPICAQQAFPIHDCRTADEVEARGLQVEHRLYPEALSWILPERFEIEGCPIGDIEGCPETPDRRIRVRQN